MIPKEFFVTKGKACSPLSELNAFDQALANAGISHLNLVAVTSILPKGCVQRRRLEIPMGAITHAVIARMDGTGGQKIGAAIAWSTKKNGKGGIVAETYGHMDERALLKAVKRKLIEMAKTRTINLTKINYVYEALRVPSGHYGCVIVALVFSPI